MTENYTGHIYGWCTRHATEGNVYVCLRNQTNLPYKFLDCVTFERLTPFINKIIKPNIDRVGLLMQDYRYIPSLDCSGVLIKYASDDKVIRVPYYYVRTGKSIQKHISNEENEHLQKWIKYQEEYRILQSNWITLMNIIEGDTVYIQDNFDLLPEHFKYGHFLPYETLADTVHTYGKIKKITPYYITVSVDTKYYNINYPYFALRPEKYCIANITSAEYHNLLTTFHKHLFATKIHSFEFKENDLVLVSQVNENMWLPAIFYRRIESNKYVTSLGIVEKCIPYKDNESLMGTIDAYNPKTNN